MLLSAIVYYFYGIEFVRENIEDAAFDMISPTVLANTKSETNAPKVMLFKVDDGYLHAHKLIDEHNETTYGYLFPRRYITGFIERVDLFTQHAPQSCPKALFIDYDFSYTSQLDGVNLSEDDKALLQRLKQKRCYTIILPKSHNHNIVEQGQDLGIQKAIQEGKVRFASVDIALAGDQIARRYYPYQTYLDASAQKKMYPNVSLMMWLLSQQKEDDFFKGFHTQKRSLIENRIIYKQQNREISTKTYHEEKSYWLQLKMYSAHYPLHNIVQENFKDALLLLGSTHSANNDVFTVDVLDRKLSGVEVHANALMTLFYLDGHLTQLPIFLTLLLVFSTIFFLDLIISHLGEKRCIFKRFHNILLVIFTSVLMLFFSMILLMYFKVWFNWLIPPLLALSTPLVLYIKGRVKGLN